MQLAHARPSHVRNGDPTNDAPKHQSRGSAGSADVQPVVVATGSKLVFVSGQEPEDLHGKLVGLDDLATQARQVFANLGRALAAAGAAPAQVARITIYVVNYDRDECLPIIEKARVGLFGDHKPADVVLGVASLSPGYLIEVDAVAVID